jgi:hypothetical protein
MPCALCESGHPPVGLLEAFGPEAVEAGTGGRLRPAGRAARRSRAAGRTASGAIAPVSLRTPGRFPYLPFPQLSSSPNRPLRIAPAWLPGFPGGQPARCGSSACRAGLRCLNEGRRPQGQGPRENVFPTDAGAGQFLPASEEDTQRPRSAGKPDSAIPGYRALRFFGLAGGGSNT